MADQDQDQGQDQEREMVVQTCKRGSAEPRAQMRRARKDGWTAERRTLFLDVLATTCNVAEAVRTVGMTVSSVYELRKRDAAFFAQWEEALERAWGELEMWVMRQVMNGTERVETVREGEPETGKVKVTKTIKSYPLTVAMRLLLSHHGTVERYRAARAAELREGATARDVLQRSLDQARDRLWAGTKDRQATGGA